MEMNINLDDLSAEAILTKVTDEHGGVAEYIDSLETEAEKVEELKETADTAEEAVEALELDSVDELVDTVEMVREQNEELKADIEELQRPKMEEDAAFIAEHTDRFGEDAEAVMEELDTVEALEDKRELVEELTAQMDQQVANPEGDAGQTGPSVQSSGKYASTPW